MNVFYNKLIGTFFWTKFMPHCDRCQKLLSYAGDNLSIYTQISSCNSTSSFNSSPKSDEMNYPKYLIPTQTITKNFENYSQDLLLIGLLFYYSYNQK